MDCHCGLKAKAKGLCLKHYNRWARVRFSEKRTFPYRPWLPAVDKGRDVIHAQAWYTTPEGTQLGAACSVNHSLDPTSEIPENWRACLVCVKIMRFHGFL